MMASHTSDYGHMQRRDSSSSTKRRPRLLRACATEPSLTASNASRDALANPQSSRRATDLLNRMAFVGGSSPDSLYRGSSPPSSQSPLYGRMDRTDELCSSPTTSHGETMDDIRTRPRAFTHHHHLTSLPKLAILRWNPDLTELPDASERYFSFPSFDTWEAEGQEDDKDGNIKPAG